MPDVIPNAETKFPEPPTITAPLPLKDSLSLYIANLPFNWSALTPWLGNPEELIAVTRPAMLVPVVL